MQRPILASYLALFFTLVLAGWLHMATFLVVVLFSYLILDKLNYFRIKWIAIVVFLVLMAAFFCGFVYFLKRAYVALPEIASTAIPMVVKFADQHGIDLPFTDLDSLKDLALSSINDYLLSLGNFAKVATKEFALLAMAVVVGIGLFVSPGLERASSGPAGAPNLYSFYGSLITERFAAFYRSFEHVMGAQLIISAINTALTAVFVYTTSLRHGHMVLAVTFLCGLLPIIGNILSNTFIVGIAFTVSPRFALWALIFLIVIHKLEYFLNSKIIGARIRNPMWLILLALILGERLMGIPGMILAPVVLNFVKTEAVQIPVVGKGKTLNAG